MPGDLEPADRASEGGPFFRVGDGFLQGQLSRYLGLDRQVEPLLLEIHHDPGESLVLDTQQVLRRHLAIHEGELGRIRGMPSHLLYLFRYRKTGGPLFDHQETYAARPLPAGAHRRCNDISARAARDEGLRSVDDIVVP